MYALFKDGKQITEASYMPIIYNHAFSKDLIFYAWIDDNTKAEVRLKKDYEIREVKNKFFQITEGTLGVYNLAAKDKEAE